MIHKAHLRRTVLIAATGLFAGAAWGIPMATVPGGGDPGGTFGDFTYGTVGYSFAIGKYEVTQQEWFDVMGTWPAWYPASDRGAHPVERVSWFGAATFCNALSQREGLTPVYNESTWAANLQADGYRLPTENEWFKAAAWDPNAAVYHTYGFGRNSCTVQDANFYQSGDAFESYGGTTPAGYYDGAHLMGDGVNLTHAETNPYGLYDLSGNVWEWSHDAWSGGTYDPQTALRTFRGGSWSFGYAASVVATARSTTAPANSSTEIGFRVVRIPEPGALGLLAGVGLLTLRRRRA
jgi:formylglycine-generating enzyme